MTVLSDTRALAGVEAPPPGSRLLAAVSGGPDSTALLVWLVEAGYDVVAATYDHALRPGSADDVAHVAALCARLGVRLAAERRQRPLASGSLQAAARDLRYEFLERTAREAGRDLVCLGHTADDVVEGALLHLRRGSGLAGLRGMPARRGRFRRPFLQVWRSDIEAYLADRGLEPVRDPSNGDARRFARARVRHFLLPQLERDRPGITARLRAAATTAAQLQERLEAEAGQLVRGGALRADLLAAPAPVRAEAYRQLYGSQPALSRRHLEAMDRLVCEGHTGAGLDLPGGLRFRLRPDRVSIGVANVPVPLPPRISVRPCAGCADARAAHLKPEGALSVGYRQPGLRMRPVGAPGTRKLQDILTDAKVPRHVRDHLPLVFQDGRLAWVPGIATDVAAAARPGAEAWHVSLEGNWETLVVVSPSAHPRSPL